MLSFLTWYRTRNTSLEKIQNSNLSTNQYRENVLSCIKQPQNNSGTTAEVRVLREVWFHYRARQFPVHMRRWGNDQSESRTKESDQSEMRTKNMDQSCARTERLSNQKTKRGFQPMSGSNEVEQPIKRQKNVQCTRFHMKRGTIKMKCMRVVSWFLGNNEVMRPVRVIK